MYEAPNWNPVSILVGLLVSITSSKSSFLEVYLFTVITFPLTLSIVSYISVASVITLSDTRKDNSNPPDNSIPFLKWYFKSKGQSK